MPALTNGGEVQRALVRAYVSPIIQRPAGQATVNFVVLANGRVDPSSITVTASTDATFGGAARAAVRAARFNPARVDGQPVMSRASLPFAWSP